MALGEAAGNGLKFSGQKRGLSGKKGSCLVRGSKQGGAPGEATEGGEKTHIDESRKKEGRRGGKTPVEPPSTRLRWGNSQKKHPFGWTRAGKKRGNKERGSGR